MSKMDQILTNEDCETILRNYTTSKDCTVSSYKIKPLSETREGLIGEHFIVQINDGTDTQRFFVKILNGSSKVIFDLCMSLNAYEKEEFFYSTLLSEFSKYKIDTSFAPKMYLCRPYLIVLEDLSTKRFKAVPKQETLSLSHCKASLDVLAKFHSASIIYEDLKSKEYGCNYSLKETYPKSFEDKLFSEEENAASRWLKHSMDGVFKLVEQIPQNHITKEQFQEKLSSTLEKLMSEKNEENISSCTLHGDLWSNNFLYLYQNDVPVSCKLIDYQLLKYGPPSADVVQFIFTNTRKAFRDEHFEELLDYYHNKCTVLLEEKGIDVSKVLSKDAYLSSCDDIKVVSKIQTIVDRSITFLSDDTYKDAFVSDEALCKFIFEERAQNIVHSFQTNEQFKELITEDMVELRDMLFK